MEDELVNRLGCELQTCTWCSVDGSGPVVSLDVRTEPTATGTVCRSHSIMFLGTYNISQILEQSCCILPVGLRPTVLSDQHIPKPLIEDWSQVQAQAVSRWRIAC